MTIPPCPAGDSRSAGQIIRLGARESAGPRPPRAKAPLPSAAGTAEVDGYTVSVRGALTAGMEHPLTVSVAKDGGPGTDLQPYLGASAHLTAFRQGDAAFAHLHPAAGTAGGHGGPDLPFHAQLPTAGNWRLFLQFRTAGTLHVTALTLHVG
jgi:hypothetical protein